MGSCISTEQGKRPSCKFCFRFLSFKFIFYLAKKKQRKRGNENSVDSIGGIAYIDLNHNFHGVDHYTHGHNTMCDNSNGDCCNDGCCCDDCFGCDMDCAGCFSCDGCNLDCGGCFG